ncbi:MAG: UDP-N-acetylmuramoyl-L-alanine--D-glutamate ligase [bacterium]
MSDRLDGSALKEARVLVAGLGVTGLAVVKFLEGKTRETFVTDTRGAERMEAAVAAARSAGAEFVPVETLGALPPVSLVVISPGVPSSAGFIAGFRERGVEVAAEIELAWRFLRGTVIAITGTNGKTTVTALVGAIVKTSFEDIRVAGNIGDPLIGAVEGSADDTVFVVEASSYQLEETARFRPRVAVVLNVAQDHVGRHPTPEAYASAKARIAGNQGRGDRLVLNYDDPVVREMSRGARSKVLYFSAEERPARGAFVEGGGVFVGEGRRWRRALDAGDVRLPGAHNALNAAASVLAACSAGVPLEAARRAVAGFGGLEHRLEKTAEIDGVTYVNDSKATNPAAAVAAMKTFPPGRIVLIIGGDDKGLDCSQLAAEAARRTRRVVLLGAALERVAAQMERAGCAVSRTAAMTEAVAESAARALAGDVVLLSPASSSFDMFKNFEERGAAFKNAVKTLSEKKKKAG